MHKQTNCYLIVSNVLSYFIVVENINLRKLKMRQIYKHVLYFLFLPRFLLRDLLPLLRLLLELDDESLLLLLRLVFRLLREIVELESLLELEELEEDFFVRGGYFLGIILRSKSLKTLTACNFSNIFSFSSASRFTFFARSNISASSFAFCCFSSIICKGKNILNTLCRLKQ